jgi:hypothetical protein
MITATLLGVDVEALPFIEDCLFLIIRETLEVLIKSSEDISVCALDSTSWGGTRHCVSVHATCLTIGGHGPAD